MSDQKAVRQFTDRTEPQLAFKNAYLDLAGRMPGCPSHVLTYYGMGGIGKSSLLKQLALNLQEDPELKQKNKGNSLYVAFNFELCQDDIQVMARLRNILNDRYGWQFPHFELGLYLYSKNVGENAEAPEQKTYIDRQPFVKLAVDAATDLIPMAGPFLKLLSYIDQGQAALRTLTKRYPQVTKAFQELDLTQQRETLSGFFAADLNEHTAKSTTPLVVLLDTYECIEERAAAQGSALRKDLWLYGKNRLIPETKNTLWVIAGRNRIQWTAEGCTMEQHLLGSLSEEDAAAFLGGAGVPQQLIKPVCDLAAGLPLYLDVCVDHYEQLLENGETPDISKFGTGDASRLIECYVRYMAPSVKELVYLLSFFPEWDEKLVRSAAAQILGSFSLADFKRVKKLSITTQAENDRYFIHRTVSEILQKDPENDLGDAAAEFMIDYFGGILKTAEPDTDDYAYAVTYCMVGGLMLYRDRDKLREFYESQISPCLDVLNRYDRKQQLLEILDAYRTRAQEKPDDLLYAGALEELAWRRWQTRAHSIAGADASLQALRLFDRLLGANHPDTLRSMHAVALALPDISHPEAVALYCRLLDRYETFHPQRQLTILNLKRNLALSYLDVKQYATAQPLLEQVLESYREQCSESDPLLLRAMRDLGNCYLRQKDYNRALELGEQALALCRKHLKSTHPGLLSAISLVAGAHGYLGNYAEQTRLREEYVQLCRRHYGPDSFKVLNAMESLSFAYNKQGDYEKEVQTLEAIAEASYKLYPDAVSGSFYITFNLPDAYKKLQEAGRAEAFYSRSMEYWREAWGIGDIRTLEWALELIEALFRRSDAPETAMLLYEQLLLEQEAQEIVFDHHSVMLLVSLSSIYCELEYHRAAYELLKLLMVWEEGNGHSLPLDYTLRTVLTALQGREAARAAHWERSRKNATFRKSRPGKGTVPCWPLEAPAEPDRQPAIPQPTEFMTMSIPQIADFLQENQDLRITRNQQSKEFWQKEYAGDQPKPICVAALQRIIRERQAQ